MLLNSGHYRNPNQIQINLTQSQIRNTNEMQEKNTQYEIETNNKKHNETDFFLDQFLIFFL